MRFSCISARASASVAWGWMVTGLTTIPDSNFLTRRTSPACRSGSRLRWMTPMPPAWAMAIAMAASVTVSIAEATMGMFRKMSRVIRERMSTSVGRTSEKPGFNKHVVEGESLAGAAVDCLGHAELLAARGDRDESRYRRPDRLRLTAFAELARVVSTRPRQWKAIGKRGIFTCSKSGYRPPPRPWGGPCRSIAWTISRCRRSSRFIWTATHRVQGRHQQQGMEHQPKQQAGYDEGNIEHRRKRLPVEQQPQGGNQHRHDVDHSCDISAKFSGINLGIPSQHSSGDCRTVISSIPHPPCPRPANRVTQTDPMTPDSVPVTNDP